MKPITARAAAALCGAAALMLQGCPSAYQRTYQQETQRLENRQRIADEQAQAAHAEAQKYAAVIYFAVGSAVIDQDGQRELTWFVQKMQPYPQAIIEVNGFADSTGGAAENQTLSQQRAANVASFLTSQGIDASRIVAQGFGEDYAAASNVSAKGRRNNRRVEVTVR
jgi:outer membrane protein OmpA-like peptidoglycan-associated protein